MAASDLPIACAINEAYLLPLAVMVESLKAHLDPGYRPVLYLIHGGMTAESLATISSLVETHAIVPSNQRLRSAPRGRHYPLEASVPLLLAEILPAGVNRVLFLDADLLILDDVAELWETPLGHNTVAAAPDGAIGLCSDRRGVKGWRERGIPKEARYFNCGVLLIDLERWRRGEFTRRVHHYLETAPGPVDFLHQEALNAVLWDGWTPLDARWNLLASVAGRRAGCGAWRRPGIIHFAGRMKPWRAPIGGPFNGPYRETMERIASLTPPHSPSTMDRMAGAYDRHLRDYLYPIEHYLWKLRLL